MTTSMVELIYSDFMRYTGSLMYYYTIDNNSGLVLMNIQEVCFEIRCLYYDVRITYC